MKSVKGREPVERAHLSVIGAGVVNSELMSKVVEGEETVGVIKALLILTMAAFDLAVMAGRIGANEFVPDAEANGGLFETGGNVLFGVGKAVGKLKAVVGLHTLNSDAPPTEPGSHLFQEVSGGVGALFLIGAQKAHAAVLVNGGVLEQAKLGVGNTGTGNYLHVHLYPLARVGHLLIRLRGVHLFRLGSRQQFQASHDTEEGFGPSGIASFA